MGTIQCPGGHSFTDGEIPSRFEFTLIPDESIEGLVGEVRGAVAKGDDVEARVGYLLLSAGPPVYRCPACGRILIFWSGIDKLAASYVPESI